MSRTDALGALTCWIVIALLFGFAAYKTAAYIQNPRKSQQELCEERGGVYVELRSGARCFAKDAFK